jgi:hypothetical protein
MQRMIVCWSAVTAPTAFFAQMSKALLEHSAKKGLQMAVDHLKDLKRLREILRKQRRKLVATMVGARRNQRNLRHWWNSRRPAMQCNGHLRTKLPQPRKAKDNEPRARPRRRNRNDSRRINTGAPMRHMNNVA